MTKKSSDFDRLEKVLARLAEYETGILHADPRVDLACKQLADRFKKKFRGSLQVAVRLTEHREAVAALTELLLSDYVARKLRDRIVPPDPEWMSELRRRLLFLSAQPGCKRRKANEDDWEEPEEGGWGNLRADLRPDREYREICEAIRMPVKEEKFSLRAAWAVRLVDLQRCLLEHEPDIVHFSGHGRQGGIVIERNDGTPWIVSGESLATLFKITGGVRCVVLNACLTSDEGELIAAQVGCAVVTWPRRVKDSEAIGFARQFFGCLAMGGDVKKAFACGCWQVREEARLTDPYMPNLFGDSSIRFVSK